MGEEFAQFVSWLGGGSAMMAFIKLFIALPMASIMIIHMLKKGKENE